MAGERVVKIKFTGDQKELDRSAKQGEESVTRWSKTVEKSNQVAAKAAALGGAAIAAALAAAVGTGLEQSQIKAKLAAQLGATGPAAQAAGDAAGDLYARGVVSSMDEAAAAVKSIFQNNLVPKDAGKAEIDAAAKRVSDLAVLLDEDAGRVGAAVSQMLRTGIADSSQEAFDILAAGAQNGLNASEDLLDTYKEYGTQFRKLGIDGPTSLGLINQALKAGARDSDVAADALKEFSIRAVDGSKTTAAGFKALGLDAELMGKNIAKGGDFANEALDVTLDKLRGVKDPVKQAQIAVQLFGTQAEDLGAALFAMDPSTATKGLGELGGAADKAGKTLEQSAGAKVQAFTRTLQDKLITALAGVIDWMGKNEQLVKTLAVTLGPLAAIIATIVAAIKIWTIVQTALNFVLTANPIGLVVAAVALLIAGIVLLWKNSETFRNVVMAVWGAIKVAIQAVVTWFQNVVVPLFKIAFNVIATAVKFLVNLWKAQFNLAVSIVLWVVNKVKAYIALLVAGFNLIVAVVKLVVADVTSRFNKLVSFIQSLPGRVTSATRNLWDGIKTGFRNAINYVIDKWNSLSFTLPSINTPFGKIGGTRIDTPNLPRLASGGWAQPGKTYTVNERGPELLTMGRERGFVQNASNTADMLGGTPEVHVYIGDRELTDMIDVQIVSSDRSKRRRAGARA